MSDNFLTEIISPQGHIFNERASFLSAPGVLGIFGVLPNHMPMIAELKTGMLVITTDKDTKTFLISNGIAYINRQQSTILVDKIVDLAQVKSLSVNDLQENLKALSKNLEQQSNELTKNRLNTEIAFINLQLKTINKTQQ